MILKRSASAERDTGCRAATGMVAGDHPRQPLIGNAHGRLVITPALARHAICLCRSDTPINDCHGFGIAFEISGSLAFNRS